MSTPLTRVLRSPRRTCRRAFTIAEVMVAGAVMAFAITTSITTMQRAFVSLDSARNITLAGQIMQSELEKMRLKDWTVISNYAAGPTTLSIDTAFTTNATIGNRFTLTRTVTSPDSTVPDLKEIKLTVTWRGYDGREASRYYVTYYGKNGLYDFFYNSY
jgi:type II secretory pathway pseudopilin PulG